jgi:hypothetical protein
MRQVLSNHTDRIGKSILREFERHAVELSVLAVLLRVPLE